MQSHIDWEKRQNWRVSIIIFNFNLYNFRLAIRLLEKETLALPDIVDILGPRPYPMKQSLLEYMEELKQRAEEMEAEE